jgi:hypothetical protein
MNGIEIEIVVLAVLIVGPFALAKAAKMRIYLLGVLLFGVLLCLLLEQISGSIHRPIVVVTARTLGNAAGYLLIATAIVHPWRRRENGPAPAYVASTVVIALLAALQLYGIRHA